MKMSENRKRQRSVIALDNHVLVVAIEGYANDWAAYIGAVKGENYEEEWCEVAEHGTKLPRTVAELLFPSFAEYLSWRY